jgi:hypothetical protein
MAWPYAQQQGMPAAGYAQAAAGYGMQHPQQHQAMYAGAHGYAAQAAAGYAGYPMAGYGAPAPGYAAAAMAAAQQAAYANFMAPGMAVAGAGAGAEEDNDPNPKIPL